MTSYAQDLAARYAAGRARLWGNAANNNAPLLIPQFLPARAVVALPPPPVAPSADELSHPYGAPLNMLAPCSWRFLVAYVALKTGVSQAEIMGRAHNPHIVAARHRAFTAVYKHTQNSMPAMGKLFDRDHTTILVAIRKYGDTNKLVEMTASQRTLDRRRNRARLSDGAQK
jgi:hypothetical protein